MNLATAKNRIASAPEKARISVVAKISAVSNGVSKLSRNFYRILNFLKFRIIDICRWVQTFCSTFNRRCNLHFGVSRQGDNTRGGESIIHD